MIYWGKMRNELASIRYEIHTAEKMKFSITKSRVSGGFGHIYYINP